MRVYLDSSAIIKRYVRERGTEAVREAYLKALSGEATLCFSLWNIGEVLGVLDKARNIGRIGREEGLLARKRFLLETRRLIRIGQLKVIPLRARILKESWELIEKHHIYQADALQITSAKAAQADKFLVADKRLHAVAVSEGLNSVLLE